MNQAQKPESTSGGIKEQSITPREKDYSQWYLDVVAAAELAEHAPVRGCMIIRPNGYAIWEMIQKTLDSMFKEKDIQNAYFPLFIPESFLKKEAEHIEGFSPELAIVTHGGGKKLDEPLVVRPTSETIIYDSFSKWINSYRDLPLLINQWANVVRWEMRTRVFLRTTEFLWQEGHTAHATAKEAEDYAMMILNSVYKVFAEEYLAMPVYTGKKSESEKFAGAKQTFAIEALMQDGKSLQSGTSHDLSDHFSKSFNVTFLDENNQTQFVYNSSWGVSTRIIGALIMIHSDDKGLVLPPKIAPTEVVIIPVSTDKDDAVVSTAREIFDKIKQNYRVKLDERFNLRAGEKYYDWEKKGVPVRIEIGPKDIAENKCVIVRRDTGEKKSVPLDSLDSTIKNVLEDIQKQLFQNALDRREKTNTKVDNWSDFTKAIEKGGFVFAHWCEDADCEAEIKEKTKASTRLLPFDAPKEPGEHTCVHCGKKAGPSRWLFAKSY